VSGHARDGRVPSGGGRAATAGRRARARFGGVHLVTRHLSADGQRLPVVLLHVLVLHVLVRVLLVRRRTVQRGAAVGLFASGRRRGGDGYGRDSGASGGGLVTAEFRRTYIGRSFAAGVCCGARGR